MSEHTLYSLATGFTKAIAKWVWAGCPMRTPDAVLHIYNTHCKPCSEIATKEDGETWCNICGCRLHATDISIRNKLALLTTDCPFVPPKWNAGVDYSDEFIEGKEEKLYEQYQELLKNKKQVTSKEVHDEKHKVMWW